MALKGPFTFFVGFTAAVGSFACLKADNQSSALCNFTVRYRTHWTFHHSSREVLAVTNEERFSLQNVEKYREAS